MKNIIFVAAPAAGKGTISAKVCTEYNIPHISTGDLLRNEIAASSKIGMEIKSAMARGEFVSDEVIIVSVPFVGVTVSKFSSDTVISASDSEFV